MATGYHSLNCANLCSVVVQEGHVSSRQLNTTLHETRLHNTRNIHATPRHNARQDATPHRFGDADMVIVLLHPWSQFSVQSLLRLMLRYEEFNITLKQTEVHDGRHLCSQSNDAEVSSMVKCPPTVGKLAKPRHSQQSLVFWRVCSLTSASRRVH